MLLASLYAVIAPSGTKNFVPLDTLLNAPLATDGGICPSKLTYFAFLKAPEPILVTELGIDKNLNVLLVLILPKLTFANALSPIVVSVFDNINVFIDVLSFNVLLAILLLHFEVLNILY